VLIPAGIPFFTEEIGAHVVINAVNLPAEAVKVGHHFRADEAARTGDKQFFEVVGHSLFVASHWHKDQCISKFMGSMIKDGWRGC